MALCSILSFRRNYLNKEINQSKNALNLPHSDRSAFTSRIKPYKASRLFFEHCKLSKLLNLPNIYDLEKYTILPELPASENSNEGKFTKAETTIEKGFEFGFQTGIFTSHKKGNQTDSYKRSMPSISYNYIFDSPELKEPPPTSLLTQICQLLGVNQEWLEEGVGQPFSPSSRVFYPSEYVETFSHRKPLKTYLILSRAPEKSLVIISQVSQYKFITYGKTWPLDPNFCEATGQRQIESLCTTLEQLHNLSPICYEGYIIEDKLFNQLISGEIYQKTILKHCNKSYWVDDLPDLTNSYRIPEKYLQMYGAWFNDAQNVIKILRTHCSWKV